MSEIKTHVVKIPFSGFYNSIHSENIDQAVNEDIEKLSEADQNTITEDFGYTLTLLNLYAKLYLKHLSKVLGIELTFDSLVRPKEYNFETDCLFAHVAEKDLLKINQNTDLTLLTAYVKEHFSSNDGFISHYSGELTEWDANILTWDHNQLSCLIELELQNNDFDETYSMDDANSNGEIASIVYDTYSLDSLAILENN